MNAIESMTGEDRSAADGATIVVDALGVRAGSAAIVISNLLAGWVLAAPEDRIVVLVDGEPPFPLQASIDVRSVGGLAKSLPGRLWAQSVGVRLACRQLHADGLLCATTASAFLGARCPDAVILYDLRHELRPQQFSALRRLSRRLLYGWSFRRAGALLCISQRTLDDLLARRPQLRDRAHAVLLGADHASGWRAGAQETPYALAFGHFANKNVEDVLQAWRVYAAGHGGMMLRLCGLGGDARSAAERLVGELDIGDRVELLPWLADDEFQAVFAGAGVVLLPSDFEGFGLPAIEAMLLGVPVVISADPALLEVTGGHAVVATDDQTQTLAGAIERALSLTPAELAAGVAHARTFTWERCARQAREIILGKH